MSVAENLNLLLNLQCRIKIIEEMDILQIICNLVSST